MRVLLAILIALASLSATAKIRDVGNGGDAVVLEFKNLAKQVATDIRLNADYLFPEFTVDQLDAAIEATELESVDKTILNGIEKDAINYPDRGLIKISRSRWVLNYDSIERQQALVLHEYLGIMRINDSDYKISSRLLGYYQKARKNILEYEVMGRFFITDQSDASTQGLVSLDPSGQVVFQGLVAGESMNCTGKFKFNANRQLLSSLVTCGDFTGELTLNFWNSDLVDFLRNGLIEIDFGFTKKNTDGTSVNIIQKTIDAKHLQ